MRRTKCFLIVLLLLPLFVVMQIEVSAVNSGFSTAALSDVDINTVLKNVNISAVSEELQKRAVECFDVNENGLIAVGCGDSEIKTVGIYTSDGAFQYGYSFKCNGSFGVELADDLLNIYIVRSDVGISVNRDGSVVSVFKIQNTAENDLYLRENIFSVVKKCGDTEYVVKNPNGLSLLFGSSYSQLVAVNKSGESDIIYSVDSSQIYGRIALVAGIALFVCVVAVYVVRLLLNSHRKNKTMRS